MVPKEKAVEPLDGARVVVLLLSELGAPKEKAEPLDGATDDPAERGAPNRKAPSPDGAIDDAAASLVAPKRSKSLVRRPVAGT